MYREKDARVYAELIAKVGVNIQPGQQVYITTYVEVVDFARILAEECWKAGAGDVTLRYVDEQVSRLRYMYASEEALGDVPEWAHAPRIDIAKKGGCFISLIADDPDALSGLDANKIGIAVRANSVASAPFHDQLDKSVNQWTVVAASSPAWAKKLFPELDTQAAVEKLWDCIYHTVRIDKADPMASWNAHSKALHNHCDILNNADLKSLHITNSLGTDLTVELVDNYLWAGGSEVTVDKNVEFQANMPTEEVFCMPHKYGVNGTVYSSMPLIYQGMTIDKFNITFKDGQVTDYDAEVGKDALDQLFSVDEGAKRLGEVALVPFKSMIRETGILFYNTLFDENASCHLAFGSAYPINMKGCVEMSDEEKDKAGCNQSKTHVDFMFGTEDLTVVGTKKDGSEIAIFENGNWAI